MNNPKRILVSEDTTLWQGIFAKLLAAEGYEVMQALDLKATLDALDKFFFNVVIVDLALDPKDESRLDGLDTMKTIARVDEGTQAIVLTGKGTVKLAVDSLRDFHVYHFLEKEKFDERAFLKILEDANAQAYRRAQGPGHFPPAEMFLGKVEWPRFASVLGVSRNDLESMFCALVRGAMPIKFKGDNLNPSIDPVTAGLTTNFWSKWLGKGVCVTIGKRDHFTIPDGQEVIEKSELGKMCGFLTSSGKSYETYVP
jgi:ActR/RegA family two-component response regulator